ncbi:MAG: DUF6067 family protein [Candidatus Omnitrophica bacterium]|nr:DUF6067 family protein [Candidatus Omnitrophota bacterium]
MKRVLILYLIFPFLCFSYIRKYEEIEKDEFLTYRYPVIRIPHVKNKPIIDGSVNKEEWSNSDLLSPLVSLQNGEMVDEIGNFFICYDEKNIYIAFQFGRVPYSSEPIAGEDPERVWQDDCVEIFLRPIFGEKWEYNFVGNVKSIYEEGKRTTSTDKKWKIKWDFKARKTDFGWGGEMGIPLKEIGIDSIEKGKVFEIAFVNNQKSPIGHFASWSYLRDWFAKNDFGYLIFGEEIPSVRILKAGEIDKNQIGVLIEISNFTSKRFNYEVEISLYKPIIEKMEYFKFVDETSNPLGPQVEREPVLEAKDVIKEVMKKIELIKEYKKDIEIEENRTLRIPFFYNFEGVGDFIIYYKIKDKDENKIVASSTIPFKKKLPLSIQITPYILSKGIIEIVADYSKIKLDKNYNIEAFLIDGEKIIEKIEMPVDLKNLRSIFEFSVKDLKPKNYKIKCQIKCSNEVKTELEQYCNLPNIPDWWDNKIGYPEVSDKVPEPYTPIIKTKNGFSVWNRDFVFDEIDEITQIKNGKDEMLTGPINIDLKLSDTLKFEKTKCIINKKTKIVYEKEIKGEKLKGKIILEGEFDGFIKYTLLLQPEEKIEIKNLSFEIPLKKEISEYYHRGAIGTPSSYSETAKNLKDYGKIPENGLKFPFVEEIWIGNENIGIEFVCETDENFSNLNDKEVVEVIVKNGKVLLKINFVNKGKVIEKPVFYQWAIIPTPVKPMNRKFQYNLYLTQSGFSVEKTLDKIPESTFRYIDAIVEAGANAFCQWSWDNPESVWNIDFGAPGYRPTEENKKRERLFREIINYAHKKGINWIIVYAIWNTFPEWPNLKNFWQESALYPLTPGIGGYVYQYCPKKVFSDWYIYTLKETIEKLDIDGVYLDSSAHPKLCTNIHHGCGYIDQNGKIHGTYPIFATREFHKRIYFLFHGGLKKNGLVYAHNSHFIYACVESFIDVHHCGEGSTLTGEILIPKFYGEPFGIPVSFTRWNNPTYPETRMNSWRFVLQCNSTIKTHPSMIISRNLMPDYKGLTRENYIKLGYDEKGEVAYKIWQLYKKFSFENSIWIPNWKIEKFAKVKDPNIWICMHLNKGKEAIVVISSFKDEKFDGFINFNWKEMGFEFPNFKILDPIIDKEIKVEENGINIDVKEKLFRVLYIFKN